MTTATVEAKGRETASPKRSTKIPTWGEVVDLGNRKATHPDRMEGREGKAVPAKELAEAGRFVDGREEDPPAMTLAAAAAAVTVATAAAKGKAEIIAEIAAKRVATRTDHPARATDLRAAALVEKVIDENGDATTTDSRQRWSQPSRPWASSQSSKPRRTTERRPCCPVFPRMRKSFSPLCLHRLGATTRNPD